MHIFMHKMAEAVTPLLYKVLWTGYKGTDEESSWLTAAELDHSAKLIEDFHKAYPAKPGPLSAL
jgi:hypothetical protein